MKVEMSEGADMYRMAGMLGLLCGLLCSTGCQCYRVTHWYGNAIDDISDFKLALDPLYVPGLDISRTGMPDWQRFGINRWLCPCRNGHCCKCEPVYYPAEYRLKYWEQQAKQDQAPEHDFTKAPELAPPPMPVENPQEELREEVPDAAEDLISE